MFDLNSLALADTFELQLKHPVTEELLFDDAEQTKPIAIVIYGTASKQYRNAINAMQNRALKRKGKQPTAEELREEGVSLLVACSVRGKNLQYEGQDVDSPEVFKQLYSNPKYSWLREQVDAGLGDIGNFLSK